MNQPNDGFTVVELLVAIVIAVLLIIAGTQVYSVALSQAGTSQRRAKANNMAYDLLRQAQAAAPTTCTASGPTTVALPDPSALPGGSASKTITCPYTTTSTNLSLISVTVTYNNPESRNITRAVIATK